MFIFLLGKIDSVIKNTESVKVREGIVKVNVKACSLETSRGSEFSATVIYILEFSRRASRGV